MIPVTMQHQNHITSISWIRWVRSKSRVVLSAVSVFYICMIYLFLKHNVYLPNDLKREEYDKGGAETMNEEHADIFQNELALESINSHLPKQLVFFLILCDEASVKGPGGNIAKDVSRQIRQASVMLKSAAALTSTSLRFIVLADSVGLFDSLVNTTMNWPSNYQTKLTFEYQEVWYPPDRNDMKKMFRVCATERLFIPEMSPNEDAGIYIDTDLIFLRPPEDLWNEFNNFNDVQVAAMAPCLYHYGTKNSQIPFFGQTGLNAGVMHMNLTRMKKFPHGGWVKANMKVFDTFKRKIKLADQDILNIVFHQNPELLYELDCAWNYRIWQCSQGANLCPDTRTDGANIIHGNALAFVNNNEMKLQTVFEVWENYKLGSSLMEFLDSLKQRLKEVSEKKLTSKCGQIANIDVVLTKQLEDSIQRIKLLK